MNRELHGLLHELREWQEKHNPITRPIKLEDYVDSIKNIDEDRHFQYPDIFPLFRLPLRSDGKINAPPSWRETNSIWQMIMGELERRWNELNPDEPIEIVDKQETTGQPQGAAYNAHGLRVAGLTQMYQSGLSVEVLSKIAGHHSVLMTLYYFKFEPAHVHRMLEEAQVRSEKMARQRFTEDIKTMSIQEARRRSAFLADDGLRAAMEMRPAFKLQFVDVELGMCPWDGTRVGTAAR